MLDADGLRFDSSSEAQRRSFDQIAEAEDAGGIIYLWRRDYGDAPIVLPTRIFADADEAKNFLAFIRTKIATRRSY
jgi:hypothetical protein